MANFKGIIQSKAERSLNFRDAISDVSLAEAGGAAIAGGITGFTMGAGSAFVTASILNPTVATYVTAGMTSGAVGGALGGQAGIAATEFFKEVGSPDGFNSSEVIPNAKANGLGSGSQIAVDFVIGGASGAVGVAAGRVVQNQLVGMKLARGYHHSYRGIGTYGGQRPRVYVHEPTSGQNNLGVGIALGVDVVIDGVVGKGGADAGCSHVDCPR